ncbi:MAG: RHS repeat-associated core domain-containing protein [Deferribacteres bacterium]|nr:RHS repeat-associated core domain-containing protein [candidate division KSB1 bacterium]MCB9503121.1 RHS repeat-associated core domain-containing protein [Deferribacteres bacterium]
MIKKQYIYLFLLAVITLCFSVQARTSVGNTKGLELKAKRTAQSKSYLDTKNNTITAVINSGYIHYQDEFKQWQEIDTDITVSDDSSHYEVIKGMFQASFAFDITSNGYPAEFMLPDSTYFRTKLYSLSYYDSSSNQLLTIQNTQSSIGNIDGNKISYPDAFTGANIEYYYNPTYLKQQLMLTQTGREYLPTPASMGLIDSTTFLVMVTKFGVPDSLDAIVSYQGIVEKNGSEIIFSYEGDAPVAFVTDSNNTKFMIPEDWAYGPMDSSAGFRMWRKIYTLDSTHYWLTGVPYSWIQSQDEGTLILDPAVNMYYPSQDRTISDDGNIFPSNDEKLYVANYLNGNVRRPLIQFDVGNWEEGQVLLSAELELRTNDHNPDELTINCYQVLKEWEESEVSWTDRQTGIPWGSPGVGIDNVDANTVSEGYFIWDDEYKQLNLFSLVNFWHENPSENFGIILVSTAGNKSTGSIEIDQTAIKLTLTLSIDPLAQFEYNESSQPTEIEFANGVVERNSYNRERGWLEKREYKKDTDILFMFESEDSGDHDPVGNIKHVTYEHKNDGSETVNYEYDALNRIKLFTDHENIQHNYTYDDNGNITTFRGTSFSYFNNSNKLQSDGNRTFDYDAKGRTTSIAGSTLEYDIFDNMIGYGYNTYAYDAENRRVKKVEGGNEVYYYGNGLQDLAVYHEQEPAKDFSNIYGLGRLLAQVDVNYQLSYFFSDHLSSTRAMGTADGTDVSFKRDYHPYGEPISAAAGQNDQSYQFTGKEKDGTELDYFGSRYYDSKIGRWLIVDPLADEFPSFSPYQYALNNPLINIDLDGDSTFAIYNGDGTYTVTGGYLSGEDDDTGIYIRDENGNYKLIANSITTHSFFNDNGKAVIGAVIDMTSMEGQNFIDNEIIAANPQLLHYMMNATKKEDYDFKMRGYKERAKDLPLLQHKYRGSITHGGKIGSARDFGNIGAGLVAGRMNLSWTIARIGFDALESIQKGYLTSEGTPTQKAQKVGHKIGQSLAKKDESRYAKWKKYGRFQ